MGFNLMFWKKKDDLDSLKDDILKDAGALGQQTPQNQGFPPPTVETTNLGVSNSFPSQPSSQNPYGGLNSNPYPTQRETYQSQSYGQELLSKNLEVISAKLDSLKVSIDSLNQRLSNIEERLKNRW